MAEHPSSHSDRHDDVSFEEKDVNWTPVIATGVGILVMLLAATFGMQPLLRYFLAEDESAYPVRKRTAQEREAAIRSGGEKARQLSPRLEGQLKKLHEWEDARLASYAEVEDKPDGQPQDGQPQDDQQRVVRIPIEAAMQMMVERNRSNGLCRRKGAIAMKLHSQRAWPVLPDGDSLSTAGQDGAWNCATTE